MDEEVAQVLAGIELVGLGEALDAGVHGAAAAGVDTDLPAHAVQLNDGALDLGDEFVLIQTPGGDEGTLGTDALALPGGAAQVDKELDGVALDPSFYP